jgi:hypothetical protein
MLSGNATGRVAAAGQSVTFSSPSGALRYEELDVTDATGTRIPARLSVAGRRLTITVADAHAVYPLRVDPEFQQSAELTASAGAASDELGYSLAVSGSTVAVGAPARDDYEGAVYVFTMPASGGWANATQTAELTASDGAPNDNLGWSVAVSGSTVVAGAALQAVGGNDSQGALYEWTMPAGGWANATQTTELTDSNGIANGDLGWSVAVSGSTIVAGAPGQGAAYEWTMPAGGWASATTQTAELSNPDADLGYSVAVSAPATTIVVGGVGYNDFSGAVYVYTLPASGGWANATQTAQLTASDGAANDYLGYSVAVSGSTIVSGTPFHDNSEGAVYEYTMPSAGGWVDATQTAELTASAGAAYDDLGWSVAVSAATIVAGAPDADNNLGAAFVYTRPASGVWGNATQSAELTSGGQFGQLGYSVAASGSTVFGGARGDSQGGAVYVFRPTVSGATVSLALSPQSIVANGTSTATATFTVGDTSGNPVTGDAVTITSSGGQTVGPVTEGSTPGTYLATITSTPTPGSATITATDTSAAQNASATTTLTQTAPPTVTPSNAPPLTVTPSNAFTITSATGSPDGAIVLGVELPGPGTVALLGTHEDVVGAVARVLEPGSRRFAWGRATMTVARARTIKITLRPDRHGRQLLARHQHYGMALNITVWVSYTPAAGNARSKKTTVRVLKATPHSR